MREMFTAVLLVGSLLAAPALAGPAIELTPIAQFAASGDSEIVAFDPGTDSLYVVNGGSTELEVVSLALPGAPESVSTIDLSPFGAGANSVAVRDGVVAVAVEADPKQAPGSVVFFAADGTFLASVTVGSLPDMLVFTPDGSRLLVANEGEPDGYCDGGVDPEGSVSVIDLTGGVASLTQAAVSTATFSALGALADGIRIFGPGASAAQDLEPEYITVSADSSTAWVTLQENNAVAVVDVASATVTAVVPLGTKRHDVAWNAMDVSNRDGAIRIAPWPTRGMYQPDAIASYTYRGETYLVTANEGDARDYDCYSEEERVEDLLLDPEAFPNAAGLQSEDELGRLKTTSANGDADGDGEYETIYSYGGRSFSIWSAEGRLIWDSGSALELITASSVPGHFNSNGPGEGVDGRSDDKGPEPESVVIGNFRGRNYAFVGLERTGGIAVYDVTNPRRPSFVTYADNVDESGAPVVGGTVDQAPEGLAFIPVEDSPNGRALLVVAHEDSGTITVFSVKPALLE